LIERTGEDRDNETDDDEDDDNRDDHDDYNNNNTELHTMMISRAFATVEFMPPSRSTFCWVSLLFFKIWFASQIKIHLHQSLAFSVAGSTDPLQSCRSSQHSKFSLSNQHPPRKIPRECWQNTYRLAY
jgi:hypothetical protein